MDLSARKSKADLAQTRCSVGCCANKRGFSGRLIFDFGSNSQCRIVTEKVKKGNFSLAFFNLSMYNTFIKVGMCWGQRQIPLVPLILRFFV